MSAADTPKRTGHHGPFRLNRDEQTVPLTAYVPESLHRACKQLAATENVTISTVVREALTAYVTRRAQSDEQ